MSITSSSPAAPAVPSLPQGKFDWYPQVGREPIEFRFAQAFCRITMSALFDLKVYGAESFPHEGGVLLVANHQSMLDPILLGAAVPRALSYMAKSELFENRLFGALIRKCGAYPVRQTGSAAGAIKETIERLQSGAALTIYAEGSRTPNGQVMPFEKGTALVVRKARVPVVPVAIHGSFEAFPTGSKGIKPHPIRMMFGPPIVLHDRKAEEITRTLEARVREMFAALRAHDPMADRNTRWALERVARERAGKTRRG